MKTIAEQIITYRDFHSYIQFSLACRMARSSSHMEAEPWCLSAWQPMRLTDIQTSSYCTFMSNE